MLPQSQVRERIYKFTPVYASVICQILKFAEFTEFSFHLGPSIHPVQKQYRTSVSFDI